MNDDVLLSILFEIQKPIPGTRNSSAYGRKDAVVRHLRQQEAEAKPVTRYPCFMCGKKFTTKEKFKKHARYYHCVILKQQGETGDLVFLN